MTAATKPTDRHIRLTIPRDLYRQLQHIAADREVRISEVILQAVRQLAAQDQA